MYKLYDFMEARERLSTITVKTKLLHSDVFSDECGNDVYIKPENLQITGSFKVRGAYNKIAKLTEEEKARGVIAASAGNHAQGVALAAKRLGIKATIVMPKHTPLIKVNATKQYGADVVLFGEIYDEAYQKGDGVCKKEHGYVFVHPFNDEDVIEGQGTIALEVLMNCLMRIFCSFLLGAVVSYLVIAACCEIKKIRVLRLWCRTRRCSECPSCLKG